MGCNPGKEKKRDYSKYLDYFNKRSGQGKYIMRELALSDLKGGLISVTYTQKTTKKIRCLFESH